MTCPSDNDDGVLIAAVRAGNADAFGQLYQRHVCAARRLARALMPAQADADDLVAEAFTRVLATLRHGKGPAQAFRAYVLTTLRRACYDRSRRDRRLQFTGDLTPYERVEPLVDTLVVEVERAYAARAFAKLPERWRLVLWHTEVEGATPAQLATLLGLSPGGVAALAYRAREGLRELYLQEHVPEPRDPTCHWAAGRLAASVRGGLRPRDRARVDGHLATCPSCRVRRGELAEVNWGLRRRHNPVP